MKDSLFILNGDIEKLKEEIKDTKSKPFTRLYEQCKWYINQKYLPSEHPLTSITYFGMAAANLSLMYKLTKQKQYLTEAKRWIFTACNFDHWGKARMPDHDLDAAWLLYGFSLAYSWIGNELDSEEKDKLRNKLILQGERIYHFAIGNEGRWWSSGYWQNHNWICYAGLAAVGYVLRDEYEPAFAWTERAKENFKIVSRIMAHDGSDYEGVVYWRYGAIWMAIYMDLLKKEENIDLFKECDFLKNTFYYRLYQAAPNLEEIINFGDCHDRRSGHSVAFYYKLASEYNNGHAQYLANVVSDNFFWREAYESGVKPGVMPEAFLELLWFDSCVKPEDFSNLPTSRYFNDLGLVVMRSGWDKDALTLSFKCSNGGGNNAWEEAEKALKEKNWHILDTQHHHPDNNSFILIGNQSYLAIDEGYSNRKSTKDHNTILVDGSGYEIDGVFDIYSKMDYKCKAEILDYMNDENYSFVTGETSKMYKKELGLNSFKRSILYTGKDYFIVLDELSSSKPHIYSWLLHSDTFAEKINSNTYLIENGPGKLYVHTLLPKRSTSCVREESVIANPTSANPSLIIEEKLKVFQLENQEVQEKIVFLNVLVCESIFDNKKVEVDNFENVYSFGAVIKRNNEKEVVVFAKDNMVLYEGITYECKWITVEYKNEDIVKIYKY